MPLAAWRIEPDGPSRLAMGFIDLEKNLEDWIAKDPGLIDPGLMVIQRQMGVEGGILDLLCVDPQGRPTVIEIKRGKLIRETIAQGIDYASSIALMPGATLRDRVQKYVGEGGGEHPGYGALMNGAPDGGEREVGVVVVGIGREPGLERMIDFLGSRFGVPIRAVTFDVFDLGEGQKVLVREETEAETPLPTASTSSYSIASVVAAAGGPDSPHGRRLLRLARAAEDHNLYVRPYKWSLMFTPQSKKTRYLMTVWKWADRDELALSYSATAFAEFFPIEAAQVTETFGLAEGRHSIRGDQDADRWAARLHDLFALISAGEEGPATPEPPTDL